MRFATFTLLPVLAAALVRADAYWTINRETKMAVDHFADDHSSNRLSLCTNNERKWSFADGTDKHNEIFLKVDGQKFAFVKSEKDCQGRCFQSETLNKYGVKSACYVTPDDFKSTQQQYSQLIEFLNDKDAQANGIYINTRRPTFIKFGHFDGY